MTDFLLKTLMDEAREKDTPEDIVQHFEYVIENKLRIPETLAVAEAIHDHLVSQLEGIADPAERLSTARAARTAYETAAAKNMEAYVAAHKGDR